MKFSTQTAVLVFVLSTVGVTAYNELHSFREILSKQNSDDTSRNGKLWPGGIIPYQIVEGFTTAERNRIQLAIDDYHIKTCLRWIPHNGEANYAYFESRIGSECADASPCFEEGKPAGMRFQTSCRDSVSIFVHEMGHVVCLDHEEARQDQDMYILHTDSQCRMGKSYHEEHLYDYLGVMHYPCDFNCSIPILPGVTSCGQIRNQQFQGGGLSVLDAEKINDLYNCEGCKSYRFRFPNQTSPECALVSGGDSSGKRFYTCRAYVDGNIIVGKTTGATTSSFGSCSLPNSYGGEFSATTDFEVLTNPAGSNLVWVRASGSIPDGAIPGGRSKINESVYIGRCFLMINGTASMIPGTVMATTPHNMRFSFKGREYTCDDFEILTCL